MSSPFFLISALLFIAVYSPITECKTTKDYMLIAPIYRISSSNSSTFEPYESIHRSLQTNPCTPPPRRSLSPPPPPPPPKSSSSEAKSWLNPHNAARKALGINPLVWDNKIAASAQAWANDLARRRCALEYGGAKGMGQNVVQWSGGKPTNTDAVNFWIKQKQDYSYGPYPNYCKGKYCGLYTQIVWKNTEKVGCGRATCSSGAIEFVCNYFPPGNVYGEYPF